MDNLSEPIMQAALRLQKIAQQHIFHKIGLSSTSVKILYIIDRKKNTTPSDIMNTVGGTRSNISQRLSHLEKMGYIVRTHHNASTDKRIVHVSLTTLGTEKIREIRKWVKKANICIEQYFTPAELAAHNAFFAKLNTLLAQAENDHLQVN